MAKYFLYFRLTLKSACKSLPKIVAGTAIFAVLLVLAALGIMKSQGDSASVQPMPVGLVLPDDGDEYTEFAFDFISEIDSIKTVCTFEQMSRDEAFDKLDDREVAAVILLPDNFAEHILNGTNTPADIVLPTTGITSQSALFRSLVTAGVDDLAAAQAGIYAADDVCRIYSIQDGIRHSEKVLNKEYFAYALDRSVYFKEQNVSATGDLSTTQFYLCSGLLGLLFLSGISCFDLFRKESGALQMCLKREGLQQWFQNVCKIASVSILYFLILAILLIIGKSTIQSKEIAALIPALNLANLTALFCIIFCIFAIIFLIYQLAGHPSTGVILLFLLAVGMLFASGNIIPAVFLPKAFATIGLLMPTTYLSHLGQEILLAQVNVLTILPILFIALCAVIISAICDKIATR